MSSCLAFVRFIFCCSVDDDDGYGYDDNRRRSYETANRNRFQIRQSEFPTSVPRYCEYYPNWNPQTTLLKKGSQVSQESNTPNPLPWLNRSISPSRSCKPQCSSSLRTTKASPKLPQSSSTNPPSTSLEPPKSSSKPSQSSSSPLLANPSLVTTSTKPSTSLKTSISPSATLPKAP